MTNLKFDIDMLTENAWRLKESNGNILQESLKFQEDGIIIGSSHTNESYWDLGENSLNIKSDKGHITSIFQDFYHLGRNYYQTYGSFDDNIKGHTSTIILESISNQEKNFLSEIGMESRFGKKTGKLIIQFNSVAQPFDGNNHHREFNVLTNLLGHDIIRISQSRPLYWYINKVTELVEILSGFISSGYQEIFLLGSSAGGYIALILSEILALRFPNIVFSTFAINPQTTLENSHIEFLYNNFHPDFIPQDVIQTDRLIDKACDTEVADFLTVEKSNILHYVFYDVNNPVEMYYYNLIKFSQRVELKPYYLGMTHGEGCKTIGDSNEFIKFLLSIVNKSYKFSSL